MESKTNYTLIGLAVLILISTLLSAALWLSVGFDRKQYNTYIVYLKEPATGLNDESPVKYNGVRVGFISDIILSPDDPQEVKLLIKVERDLLITKSTQATLISQGITGTTYLGLNAKDATLLPLEKTANEPYPVIPYQPSFYFKLEQNVNHLSESLNTVLNKENLKNLKDTLRHLNEITSAIAAHDAAIKESIQQLPVLISALKNSADKVNIMASDVSIAGKQFTQTMKAGKNTIDQLSQQTLPIAITLLEKLDLIAANLITLSEELRQNPSVIIRGVTPPPPGPGE